MILTKHVSLYWRCVSFIVRFRATCLVTSKCSVRPMADTICTVKSSGEHCCVGGSSCSEVHLPPCVLADKGVSQRPSWVRCLPTTQDKIFLRLHHTSLIHVIRAFRNVPLVQLSTKSNDVTEHLASSESAASNALKLKVPPKIMTSTQKAWNELTESGRSKEEEMERRLMLVIRSCCTRQI
jgi:hypothetical protein